MKQPLASAILETVPLVMHDLRKEVRRQRDPSLTIEEFRVMMYIGQHPGSDLSSAADHVGLSLPSVSKIVDSLIRKRFVIRTESTVDRRCLLLSLTPKGGRALGESKLAAETYIVGKVRQLSPALQRDIGEALLLLRSVFAGPTNGERRQK